MQKASLSWPNIHHIRVRLQQLRHLCEAPHFDPFAARSDHLSAVERIFREIRRKQPGGAVRVAIFLPVDYFSTERRQAQWAP